MAEERVRRQWRSCHNFSVPLFVSCKSRWVSTTIDPAVLFIEWHLKWASRFVSKLIRSCCRRTLSHDSSPWRLTSSLARCKVMVEQHRNPNCSYLAQSQSRTISPASVDYCLLWQVCCWAFFCTKIMPYQNCRMLKHYSLYVRTGLDQTVVANVLPIIANVFNALENLTWIPTAFLITQVACLPLFGQLPVVFPIKWVITLIVPQRRNDENLST